MAVTLGHQRWARKIIRVFEAVLPIPSHGVLLRVTGEVAYARKRNIQSVEYLRERQRLYERIAGERGFVVVDANQPAQAVCEDVLALVRSEGLD